jgi:hypothetical protein
MKTWHQEPDEHNHVWEPCDCNTSDRAWCGICLISNDAHATSIK